MTELPAAAAVSADRTRLREIELPASDQPLRDDVNRLGALVGELIAEQEGAIFFAEVERLRRAAILRREADEDAVALEAELAGRPLAEAEALVRSFATWFGAVNLAERVHRIRRRRDYQKSGAGAQPGGLQATADALRAAGVSTVEFAELLQRLHIEPVFTAHPTEAVRRDLLEKEREVVGCLVDDLDGHLTPQERNAAWERIRTALTAAWQTSEHAPDKPTVLDELEHVGYYLSEVLYRVLPGFVEALERSCGLPQGSAARALCFGSWVGGDMDGNPNVGADTMRAALARQQALLLGAYKGDLKRLSALLSQSEQRVQFSPALRRRIADYLPRFPKAASQVQRHRQMPYRQLLALIAARLSATLRDERSGYAAPDAFIADLQLILDSLLDGRGEHAGAALVRRLQRRVEVFGFHLATLDLRQDSRVHEAAIGALLAQSGWSQLTAAERLRQLLQAWQEDAMPTDPGADVAQPVLAVFAARRELRERYGERAFGPMIVSMSRNAADALGVLLLARWAGDRGDDGSVPLDVAPLFETVDDLDAAAAIMRELFELPQYRDHLRRRGDMQMVMLGYSDSAKDAGLPASRWAIQRCQIQLCALAQEFSIKLRFFHGRGGSTSRGGSKTERAVIAAPRGSVDGYLRLTEQGEVIHRKYGIRALALRNLEQMSAAVLRASLRPRPPEPREALWRQRMDAIAIDARASYRGLVHQCAEFIPYFRAATPIDVIERLRLGSRPSKRAAGGQAGVESLRAIPWVFAWSQNRSGLTAWYGAGAALQAAITRHGRDAIAEMVRDWPFFATFIDDIEMVLAKSDLGIFAAYSRLADERLHAALYPRIAGEFERTRQAILQLRGADELLQADRRLALSIRLRNPYVDPISLLQVDLLRRWRAGGSAEDATFHALVATVNGIAAGVQNTG